MRQPRILLFSGSARAGSHNSKLAALVTKKLALADADVTLVSLKDYPMPLFDADLETRDGVPQNAQKLKRMMQQQDGVFIACPEYNAGITPLLKNTLDWISRVSDPGEPSSPAFKDRVFALGAALSGRFRRDEGADRHAHDPGSGARCLGDPANDCGLAGDPSL
jgi:chromate reductase